MKPGDDFPGCLLIYTPVFIHIRRKVVRKSDTFGVVELPVEAQCFLTRPEQNCVKAGRSLYT